MPFTRLAERRQKNIDRSKEEFNRSVAFLNKIKNVFGSSDGIDVLDWILEECGVMDSIFTGNSETFYKSGRQDFGNDLIAEIIKADPQIFHTLVSRWALIAEEAKSRDMNELWEKEQ